MVNNIYIYIFVDQIKFTVIKEYGNVNLLKKWRVSIPILENVKLTHTHIYIYMT